MTITLSLNDSRPVVQELWRQGFSPSLVPGPGRSVHLTWSGDAPISYTPRINRNPEARLCTYPSGPFGRDRADSIAREIRRRGCPAVVVSVLGGFSVQWEEPGGEA